MPNHRGGRFPERRYPAHRFHVLSSAGAGDLCGQRGQVPNRQHHFPPTLSGVATVAPGDFNNDGNYDFVAVVVGDQTAAHPGGVQIFLENDEGTFKTGASYLGKQR